jgi:hypothetical protein
MHDEAELVYRIYWKNIQRMTEIKAGYAESLDKAQKAFEAAPRDAANRKQLIAERNKAQAALYFYEERQHKELKALISFVRKWAEQKHENRLGYLQALYEIVCRGKGQGSIVFYAFPQELVNQIVERTGGRPVTVAIPELVDGEIEIDPEGRVFLVDQVAQADGSPVERHIFLMQVTEDGRVLMDYGPDGQAVEQKRIQPFRFQPGRSELRDGKILFPGSQQRPHIPPVQAYR